ncbi:hypothetical protein pEaSNUABM22_00172 [Erwinia phage pEa_SNUABM_22]|uniref:Uncharacterized protein n=1 Tax=Erwinia phage pEa_SNUABM_22 TaxID=2869549 RepID=A0AAE8XRG4_9CAUD|nr:hypothetical protein MPK63_gp171 [Erwinia phage pEa_SNUABM_22]UAW96659.1 hypothetical protein pEaSNUABM22_00172 [Erwinia phage pEa_SNUABM_22]
MPQTSLNEVVSTEDVLQQQMLMVVQQMNALLKKSGSNIKVHSLYEKDLGELRGIYKADIKIVWQRTGACAGRTCVYDDFDVSVSGLDEVCMAIDSIDLVITNAEDSTILVDGQTHTWTLTNVMFKCLKEEPAPKRNIQTTYLAMQGIYPDLPPFSKLTLDQKRMIRNHVEMLADYLRK